MKKLTMLTIAAICLVYNGCAELNMLIPPTLSPGYGLTTDEIVRGLKEALAVSAANSASSASIMNGFYGNPQIFIPFPEEAIKVKTTLRQAGLSNLITDFERSLNRAAEEASRKALPIFSNAITSISFTDAMGILKGPDNAATRYLAVKTTDALKAEFLPVVRTAIQTVKVTSYWNPVSTAYNTTARLTGQSRVNPNLEEYITEKTLDGLFILIAEEEKKIRHDPAARVTDILKKVFTAQ